MQIIIIQQGDELLHDARSRTSRIAFQHQLARQFILVIVVVVPETGDDGLGRGLGRIVSVGRIVRDIGVEDGIGILPDLDKSQIGGIALRPLGRHLPHDDVVGVPAIKIYK